MSVEDEIAASDYFEDIPDVLPWDRQHDGWDGAAGAEIQDTTYEPYPHMWDYTLRWCQIRFAVYYKKYEEIGSSDRAVERIPNWIVRRALPNLRGWR